MSFVHETWVHSNFHFVAEFDGVEIAFQEISGMSIETKVLEYRDGSSPQFYNRKRLAQTSFGDWTFKKGVFAGGSQILDFANLVFEHNYMSEETGRIDIIVRMLDENGSEVMLWNLHNCIPTKITLGGLKSDSNDAAIEELTVAVESVDWQHVG